jgi:hypothetical protein
LACHDLYGEEFGANRGCSKSIWATPVSILQQNTERLLAKSIADGMTICGLKPPNHRRGNDLSGRYPTKASFVISDNLARICPPSGGTMSKMGKRKSLSFERLLDEMRKFLRPKGA